MFCPRVLLFQNLRRCPFCRRPRQRPIAPMITALTRKTINPARRAVNQENPSEFMRNISLPLSAPSGIARQKAGTDNRSMSNGSKAQNEWQRRIQRAEELGSQYTFAAEILRFYVAVARFQETFSRGLAKSVHRTISSVWSADPLRTRALCTAAPSPAVARLFGEFLSVSNRAVRPRFGKRRASCGRRRRFPFPFADGFLEWNRGRSAAAGPSRFFCPRLSSAVCASPFVRGQLCNGAGRCRFSVRFANGNPAWVFCARWEMAGSVPWSVHFVWRNGSSGESSVRHAAKRTTRSFPSTPPRNSITFAWKLATVAGPTSKRWT